MVGILIIAHGHLAAALISSAQILVGPMEKIKGVSILPGDNKEEIQQRIEKEIEEVDNGEGVIILTDLLGGTPTNLSLSFLHDRRIAVVTGVNIPMLLALASYQKDKSLAEIARLVKKAGQRSITLAQNVGLAARKKKWISWYTRFPFKQKNRSSIEERK
ncbi:MAG: PTS sugar transporter subunit IIA [Thermodesulfobacteriota bacterium]